MAHPRVYISSTYYDLKNLLKVPVAMAYPILRYTPLKLHFEPNLDYQRQAVEAGL